MKKEFSSIFQRIIEKHNIKLKDLSQETKISLSFLSNLKTGRRLLLSTQKLDALSKGLLEKFYVPKEDVNALVQVANMQEEKIEFKFIENWIEDIGENQNQIVDIQAKQSINDLLETNHISNVDTSYLFTLAIKFLESAYVKAKEERLEIITTWIKNTRYDKGISPDKEEEEKFIAMLKKFGTSGCKITWLVSKEVLDSINIINYFLYKYITTQGISIYEIFQDVWQPGFFVISGIGGFFYLPISKVEFFVQFLNESAADGFISHLSYRMQVQRLEPVIETKTHEKVLIDFYNKQEDMANAEELALPDERFGIIPIFSALYIDQELWIEIKKLQFKLEKEDNSLDMRKIKELIERRNSIHRKRLKQGKERIIYSRPYIEKKIEKMKEALSKSDSVIEQKIKACEINQETDYAMQKIKAYEMLLNKNVDIQDCAIRDYAMQKVEAYAILSQIINVLKTLINYPKFHVGFWKEFYITIGVVGNATFFRSTTKDSLNKLSHDDNVQAWTKNVKVTAAIRNSLDFIWKNKILDNDKTETDEGRKSVINWIMCKTFFYMSKRDMPKEEFFYFIQKLFKINPPLKPEEYFRMLFFQELNAKKIVVISSAYPTATLPKQVSNWSENHPIKMRCEIFNSHVIKKLEKCSFFWNEEEVENYRQHHLYFGMDKAFPSDVVEAHINQVKLLLNTYPIRTGNVSLLNNFFGKKISIEIEIIDDTYIFITKGPSHGGFFLQDKDTSLSLEKYFIDFMI